MSTEPIPGVYAVGGAAMIAIERERQIGSEGWTPEHDDEHDQGEIAWAATCYIRESLGFDGIFDWPWETSGWKPSDDPVRNLVKAGALIAAEIDRLQRTQTPKPPTHDFIPYAANPGICSVCGAVKPMPCYAIGPS